MDENENKRKFDFINRRNNGVYNDEDGLDPNNYRYNSKWRFIMNSIGLKKES